MDGVRSTVVYLCRGRMWGRPTTLMLRCAVEIGPAAVLCSFCPSALHLKLRIVRHKSVGPHGCLQRCIVARWNSLVLVPKVGRGQPRSLARRPGLRG
jgi:hypothetical protein